MITLYQSMFYIFLMIYAHLSWISDTENDPSGNLNLSLHVASKISNLLFVLDVFIFFHV